MGGFFGVTSKGNCTFDLFFGIDYHSHLGTRRGGMTVYDPEKGFQRAIHKIENSPFRTKFENDVAEMRGLSGIGCISDYEPQPLLVRSRLGPFAITTVGRINNLDALTDAFFQNSQGRFMEMSGGKINPTELVASLIVGADSITEGIRYAQERIDGSMSILLLTETGIYAARDRYGRLPVLIGKRQDGYCVSFESFAYEKLGYTDERELGPGEIVLLTPDGLQVMAGPGSAMKICAFLWTYYGYPNSRYEGVTVETMRYASGKALAEEDEAAALAPDIDSVAGIPDSGTAHAIGYANRRGIPFSRPFIKYTPTWPRSFMPTHQAMRNLVAKMKLIPVQTLIQGKKLLFIDDSIVRGTQMRETVDFLYNSGAKEVHVRAACPPILFGCKYLNFSRSTSEMDLIARKTIAELEGDAGAQHLDAYADASTDRGKAMRACIGEKLCLTSLGYLSLDGLTDAIGLDPCKICTYCWTGKE